MYKRLTVNFSIIRSIKLFLMFCLFNFIIMYPFSKTMKEDTFFILLVLYSIIAVLMYYRNDFNVEVHKQACIMTHLSKVSEQKAHNYDWDVRIHEKANRCMEQANVVQKEAEMLAERWLNNYDSYVK